jgi:hypothetical protein
LTTTAHPRQLFLPLASAAATIDLAARSSSFCPSLLFPVFPIQSPNSATAFVVPAAPFVHFSTIGPHNTNKAQYRCTPLALALNCILAMVTA